LFYAYGIGLLKAQRFGDLFKLFSTPINTGRDHIPTVASHLLLGRWEGMENDPWKRFMPDLEKRKTALSDHLHDLFESWTVDYLFTKGDTPACSSILNCWGRSLTSLFQMTKPRCRQKYRTRAVWSGVRWVGQHGTAASAVRFLTAGKAMLGRFY
jgi:hypothetical protein